MASLRFGARTFKGLLALRRSMGVSEILQGVVARRVIPHVASVFHDPVGNASLTNSVSKPPHKIEQTLSRSIHNFSLGVMHVDPDGTVTPRKPPKRVVLVGPSLSLLVEMTKSQKESEFVVFMAPSWEQKLLAEYRKTRKKDILGMGDHFWGQPCGDLPIFYKEALLKSSVLPKELSRFSDMSEDELDKTFPTVYEIAAARDYIIKKITEDNNRIMVIEQYVTSVSSKGVFNGKDGKPLYKDTDKSIRDDTVYFDGSKERNKLFTDHDQNVCRIFSPNDFGSEEMRECIQDKKEGSLVFAGFGPTTIWAVSSYLSEDNLGQKIVIVLPDDYEKIYNIKDNDFSSIFESGVPFNKGTMPDGSMSPMQKIKDAYDKGQICFGVSSTLNIDSTATASFRPIGTDAIAKGGWSLDDDNVVSMQVKAVFNFTGYQPNPLSLKTKLSLGPSQQLTLPSHDAVYAPKNSPPGSAPYLAARIQGLIFSGKEQFVSPSALGHVTAGLLGEKEKRFILDVNIFNEIITKKIKEMFPRVENSPNKKELMQMFSEAYSEHLKTHPKMDGIENESIVKLMVKNFSDKIEKLYDAAMVMDDHSLWPSKKKLQLGDDPFATEARENEEKIQAAAQKKLNDNHHGYNDFDDQTTSKQAEGHGGYLTVGAALDSALEKQKKPLYFLNTLNRPKKPLKPDNKNKPEDSSGSNLGLD